MSHTHNLVNCFGMAISSKVKYENGNSNSRSPMREDTIVKEEFDETAIEINVIEPYVIKKLFNKFDFLYKAEQDVDVKQHDVDDFETETISIDEERLSFNAECELPTLTDRPFSCQLCWYKCAFASWLKQHMKTHREGYLNLQMTTGIEPVFCSICQNRYDSVDDLKFHIGSHTGKNVYCCSSCTYESLYRADLINHMKKHNSEKRYTCEVCQYKFVYRKAFRKHVKSHPDYHLNRFACKICAERFSWKNQLVQHMKTHRPPGAQTFICDICQYRCSKKVSLIRHLSKHTRKDVSCHICHYNSLDRNVLNNHVNTHSKLVYNKKRLTNHTHKSRSASVRKYTRDMKNNWRSRAKIFKCDNCLYKCSKKSQMAQHVLSHTQKQYSCEICHFKSMYENVLVNHMQTHNRPFCTDDCLAQCLHRSNTKAHIKTYTRRKLLSCKVCDYRCYTIVVLAEHIRGHLDSKESVELTQDNL